MWQVCFDVLAIHDVPFMLFNIISQHYLRITFHQKLKVLTIVFVKYFPFSWLKDNCFIIRKFCDHD